MDDSILLIILSGILGIITGSLFSLTFFRLEKAWSRSFMTIITGVAPIPGLMVVLKTFEMNQHIKLWCLTVYFILLFLSYIVVLRWLLMKLGKHNSNTGDSFAVRDIDILLGYKNAISDYYLKRREDAEIDVAKLKERDTKLKQLESSVSRRQDLLNEKEAALNQQISERITIKYPVDYSFPLNQEFIHNIPGYALKFQRFSFYASILAEDIGRKYLENELNGDSNGRIASEKLSEFAKGICSYSSTYLFPSEVRTHFRYLHGNKEYRGLATSFDQSGYSHRITPIPKNEVNLISKSGILHRSLLRNFNMDDEFCTRSKHWKNFLTLALTDHLFLNDDAEPLLSMAISIPEIDFNEEMLRFLNFLGFERFIEQVYIQFNRYVNCRKAIDFLSSQP